MRQTEIPRQLPPLEEKKAKLWTNQRVAILTLVSFMLGVGLGSLTRTSSPPVVGTAAAANSQAGENTSNEFRKAPSAEALRSMVEPLLARIKADPKNADALVQLGNVYYDHKMFNEAVEYYSRAIDIDASNVDVRTDLGTAYWYLGSPEKAIAEYEKALAIQPDYPQTLMNLGIVRMDGLKDRQGAIKAWKRLLDKNASFPQRKSVEQLIAKAETQ